MTNGKLRGHEIDWRHYVSDRQSKIPRGYFEQELPNHWKPPHGMGDRWFYLILGAAIGAIFATFACVSMIALVCR